MRHSSGAVSSSDTSESDKHTILLLMRHSSGAVSSGDDWTIHVGVCRLLMRHSSRSRVEHAWIVAPSAL